MNKTLVKSLPIILLSFLLLAFFFSSNISSLTNNNSDEPLLMNNVVVLELYDSNGNLKNKIETHNSLTVSGKHQILALISGQTVSLTGTSESNILGLYAKPIDNMILEGECSTCVFNNRSDLTSTESTLSSDTVDFKTTFGAGNFIGTVEKVSLYFPVDSEPNFGVVGSPQNLQWNEIILSDPLEKGENDILNVTVTVGFK